MTSTSLVKGNTGEWEVIIGLEVHAQVISKAKLFSSASTNFGAEPNEQVSFIDAGFPGMLPVINEACVDQAIKSGLGIKGTINKVSIFDRKNYFYADLPNGYQISQFYYPIVSDGSLEIDLEDGTKKTVSIERIHLEQDAGKSIHDLHPSKSYIDLNRAGIALMEVVSRPDMRSSSEAQAYVKKLRSIFRYLQTCDGNMEQGSLRVDANVSVRRPGEPLGTRAEIKNVNSIRFLGQAIDYEVARQIELIESGGQVIQETRLFDHSKGETRSMRSKENAQDYRYFPDPDLLPLRLSDERINAIKATMPELPDEKAIRFKDSFGLNDYDASVMVGEKEVADFYEACVEASTFKDKHVSGKMIANWLMGEVFALLNKEGKSITTMDLKAFHLAELVDLILDETLSGKMAKDVFLKLWETGESAKALVEKLGLKQITDPFAIKEAVNAILANEAEKVADYRSGKDKLFGFFVGLVMKEMKGKANPALVNTVLKELLDQK
ncbi:MAG TPA: Asp-tRNA(Asn)/Glu-tRNA(Gln) amidotransferase subunit GatB [Alphaproteobacteria bacterium]|nr:Asp-tRNA(Asn)/Glu-tRNA(Gln) amidotransferase subunit GatB [Alphaproteobacteria bacterium]